MDDESCSWPVDELLKNSWIDIYKNEKDSFLKYYFCRETIF
jgi:hypothetical protein